MRVARNDKELEALIQKDIRRAMSKAERKALGDMYETTYGFYTTGDPKKYERTGLLGSTPRTSTNTDGMGFEAYLDTSTGYTTGSKPGMEKVLGWAETQSAGIVGGPFKWEDTEKKIVQDADAALSEYFDK